MSATDSSSPWHEQTWHAQLSAVMILLVGGAYVLNSPDPGSGVGRLVSLAVRGALLVAVGCLCLSVLGRRVELPYPREWFATAATVTGFAVVVVNGARATAVAVAEEGTREVFLMTLVIAVAVGGTLGLLFGLGFLFDR